MSQNILDAPSTEQDLREACLAYAIEALSDSNLINSTGSVTVLAKSFYVWIVEGKP